MRGISAAIVAAEESLRPADPMDVVKAMAMIAERKGVELPSSRLLELDAELVAEMPADLFPEAFKRLYRTFKWNRLPEVADWEATVMEEWQARKRDLRLLLDLEQKFVMKAQRARNAIDPLALPAPCESGGLCTAKGAGTLQRLRTAV